MKKYLSKIILIFALLFFVLAIVLFVQAVLGSILFDFNYTETLVMLGAVFAGCAACALADHRPAGGGQKVERFL